MPDTTVTVRIVRGEFRYDREHYERGDELEVHEGALEKHPRTLERVEEDDGSDEDEDIDELDPHPADLTVGELEDRIEDVEDPALIKTIRKAEEESKDRETATDAIDARLKELGG
ncbi:hypothetical protein [Halostella pelagica]|uniref:hypothetical protein n=1 Tax=Halostella pelagica TaxID=2583824 RepID=UPI0010807CED|nr:hypothetical protein [Halostella pelagica]